MIKRIDPFLAFGLSILLLLVSFKSIAQDEEPVNTYQLWIDFVADFYTGDVGMLDVSLAFNQWINKRDEWNEITFAPIYELSPNYRFDLFAGVILARTEQNANFLTLETRPLAGFRLNFSTSRNKVFIRYRFRYEWRHFYYVNGDSTEFYNRVRNRLEALISLNRANHQTDKNLYLKADFEIFSNLDDVPDERFVNTTRTRLGLGYRLNPAWRFELLYTLQTSFNALEHSKPESFDHIIRVFFKRYFFY